MFWSTFWTPDPFNSKRKLQNMWSDFSVLDLFLDLRSFQLKAEGAKYVSQNMEKLAQNWYFWSKTQGGNACSNTHFPFVKRSQKLLLQTYYILQTDIGRTWIFKALLHNSPFGATRLHLSHGGCGPAATIQITVALSYSLHTLGERCRDVQWESNKREDSYSWGWVLCGPAKQDSDKQPNFTPTVSTLFSNFPRILTL